MGLDNTHALVRFANSPNDIENVIKLDDTVVWGALSQLRESEDRLISSFAERLQDRKLFKCIDIRALVHHEIDSESFGKSEYIELIDKCCAKVLKKLNELKEKKMTSNGIPAILTDKESRSPYKTGGRSHGPLERINVRTEGGDLMDLKQRSDVVAALRDFKLTRAYYDPEYPEVAKEINAIVKEEVGHVTVET